MMGFLDNFVWNFSDKYPFVPYAFHLEDKLLELRTPVAPPETDLENDW